jgi:lysophospholipase L1-like esterase
MRTAAAFEHGEDRGMSGGIVSLGDSLSCGEGVGVRVPLHRTWVHLVADAMGLPASVLASPGARTRDVRYRQLPLMPQQRALLVTLLVGYNDVAGPGFEPATLADDLVHVVREARSGGDLLVLWRLADPTDRLPVPRRAADAVRHRVRLVNDAIDGCADDGATVLLDLADVAGLARRDAWAVDRLHPSAFGHYLMAGHAVEMLRAIGIPIAGSIPDPTPEPVPTRADEWYWLARHGTPWAACNVGRIGRPALAMLRGAQRPTLRRESQMPGRRRDPAGPRPTAPARRRQNEPAR